MSRVAAVDPGKVRVGIAVSDEDQEFAHPRPPVSGEGTPEQVARRIGEALADAPTPTVVVGLPLQLDGREGTSARAAKTLARAIRDVLGVKVVMADERLTTAQATRTLDELGVRGRDRRAAVDSAAAVVLLQCALERRKSRGWPSRPSEAPAESARVPAGTSPPGNEPRGRSRR